MFARISAQIAVLLVVFSFRAFCQEQIVLYPGTFDVFHNAHFEEATQVFNHFPHVQKLIILPIESAYYSERLGPQQITFPALFNYPSRVAYIKAIFKDRNDVVISQDLKTIHKSICSKLLEIWKKHKTKTNTVSFLIGLDVLERWKNLPEFENFLSQVFIIVSNDPRMPELEDTLRQQYKDSDRVQFVSLVKEGVRSRNVITKFMTFDPALSKLIPEKGFAYLQAHPNFRLSIFRNYCVHSAKYLAALVEEILTPGSLFFPQIDRDLENLDYFKENLHHCLSHL